MRKSINFPPLAGLIRPKGPMIFDLDPSGHQKSPQATYGSNSGLKVLMGRILDAIFDKFPASGGIKSAYGRGTFPFPPLAELKSPRRLRNQFSSFARNQSAQIGPKMVKIASFKAADFGRRPIYLAFSAKGGIIRSKFDRNLSRIDQRPILRAKCSLCIKFPTKSDYNGPKGPKIVKIRPKWPENGPQRGPNL